jgi:hypothetical protein
MGKSGLGQLQAQLSDSRIRFAALRWIHSHRERSINATASREILGRCQSEFIGIRPTTWYA